MPSPGWHQLGGAMPRLRQVIESTRLFAILSDGSDARFASNAYMPRVKPAF